MSLSAGFPCIDSEFDLGLWLRSADEMAQNIASVPICSDSSSEFGGHVTIFENNVIKTDEFFVNNALMLRSSTEENNISSERFKPLDESELDQLLEDAESKATKRNTNWAIRTFEGKFFQVLY